MRVGQKNKLTYRWARTGSRPRAVHDQRTQSTYLFGAVCPERGTGSGLVLPVCNAEAMQFHLDDISTKVAPCAHACLAVGLDETSSPPSATGAELGSERSEEDGTARQPDRQELFNRNSPDVRDGHM